MCSPEDVSFRFFKCFKFEGQFFFLKFLYTIWNDIPSNSSIRGEIFFNRKDCFEYLGFNFKVTFDFNNSSNVIETFYLETFLQKTFLKFVVMFYQYTIYTSYRNFYSSNFHPILNYLSIQF